MAIRTAADIHRLNRFPLTSIPVATPLDYRRAHAAAIHTIAGTITISLERLYVYVDGWKWCVTCTAPDCSNRPMYGWGIACCFDCGFIYEGLELPEEAIEIERLLGLRPRMSQRSWLLTESLDDLRAQNLEIGAAI